MAGSPGRALHLNKLLLPATNMGLRGAGLVARFALSIYIVKYLDLSSVGLFGLISGVLGFLPTLIGFGINYFFCRELVGAPPRQAGEKLRNRLSFTVACLCLLLLCSGVFMTAFRIPFPAHSGIIALIILLDVTAFDVQVALISLRMPVFSNFLLFIRSSSWIFPFITLSFYFSSYRSLSFLLDTWCSSLVLFYVFLAYHLRNWPWNIIGNTSLDFSEFIFGFKRRLLIYISDLIK